MRSEGDVQTARFAREADAVAEKRQFRRVLLVTPVEAAAGGRTYHYESRNISAGGMLLKCEETLRENTTFQMKFSLPGLAEPITVTGIVQHVSPQAFMGVRFGELSEPVRAAIERFVRESPATAP